MKRLWSLLLVLLVAGCSAPPEPLRGASNDWIGYQPLYLAQERGLFRGSPVHLAMLPSNSEVIRAFRNGLIDFAALTADEAMLLQQSGIDICLPLVLDTSNGADAIIAHRGITSLAALKGRRVGVENTAVGAYMMVRGLERAGLKPTDVDVVPLELGEQEAAFDQGRIDAVVTFDPVRSRLLARGAVQLFDSSQIPGEVIDVLVVRRSYLSGHRAVMRELTDGWYEALDYMAAHPRESDLVNGRRIGLTAAQYRRALSGLSTPSREENAKQLYGATPQLVPVLERLMHIMVKQSLLRGPLPTGRLFCGEAR